jgi:hypothetical protein
VLSLLCGGSIGRNFLQEISGMGVAVHAGYAISGEIPYGIGEYRSPDASSAAVAGFSEAIQWPVSSPRGREAARADFTP